METVLDIFKNDAFSFGALRRVADNAPYIPTLLGGMNLFDDKPLTGTDKVFIYEEDSNIRIIPTTERGGPDIQQQRDTGRFFALQTPRLSKMDGIRAAEFLNLGATVLPPAGIVLRTAQELLVKRRDKLNADLAATKEYHRLGAIQGKVLDADGTRVVFDSFSTFGITQPAAITFNFSTLGVDDLNDFITQNIIIPMQLALKDRWVNGTTYVTALVGDTFFSKLIKHPSVREIWRLNQQTQNIQMASNPLAIPRNWQSIDFGGVRWVNYRASTDGVIGIGTSAAKFFPVGARDVFDVYWAPGETFEQAREPGKPDYLMIQPDVRTQMADHVDVYLRSYPLYACIFPKALFSGTAA